MTQETRKVLERLLDRPVDPGLEDWARAIGEVQSNPPPEHFPGLHTGGVDQAWSTCSCGWKGERKEGLPLAADDWLLHIADHLEEVIDTK